MRDVGCLQVERCKSSVCAHGVLCTLCSWLRDGRAPPAEHASCKATARLLTYSARPQQRGSAAIARRHALGGVCPMWRARQQSSKLSSMEQAPAPAPAAPTQWPDWANGLPLELWQRCFAKEDERAAFGACRRLARAVLLTSLQQEKPARLRWDVDRAEACGPSAKLVQALVGEHDSKGITLVLFSSGVYGSPARCLAELGASGAALTCITRLETQVRSARPAADAKRSTGSASPPHVLIHHDACSHGLSLDTLIPDAVHVVLPNLRHLRIASCQLTAAAATSLVDTACSNLEVQALSGEPTHRSFQLMQLAGLASLSSLSLLDSTCPTLFLNTLGTRLTALHLDESYGQVQPDTDTPTPTWRSTLQHVARCTALQSLTAPCVTSEELGLVAPALQQLRRLRLRWPYAVAVDGDAMVERLLSLPHLTSLQCEDISGYSFQRSHASSPCRWRELSFDSVSPHQLARLPLHSLTSPVAWRTILVNPLTSVAEAQSAVDNVTRRCFAGGGAWSDAELWPTLQFLPPAGSGTFTRGAGEGDTPAALLRALRSLLAAPGPHRLLVGGLAWDVEVVQALGEVLPRTCVRLRLHSGSLTAGAAVQLARSLPWLEALALAEVAVQPAHAFTAYATAATCLPDALRADGGPRLRLVSISEPVRPEGVGEEAHVAQWQEVQAAVRGLGVEATITFA